MRIGWSIVRLLGRIGIGRLSVAIRPIIAAIRWYYPSIWLRLSRVRIAVVVTIRLIWIRIEAIIITIHITVVVWLGGIDVTIWLIGIWVKAIITIVRLSRINITIAIHISLIVSIWIESVVIWLSRINIAIAIHISLIVSIWIETIIHVPLVSLVVWIKSVVISGINDIVSSIRIVSAVEQTNDVDSGRLTSGV